MVRITRCIPTAARILCGFALAAILVAAPVTGHGALGESINHLTFSAPVLVPGVVLPPGEYTFEAIRADVVRVSSRDRRLVLYTGFTHRVARPRGLNAGAVVTFGEPEKGAATPIREWYPSATGHGHEFIYR